MLNWLSDPNTRWVLAGCVLLGLCSGMLGRLALMRRRSLVGDALAHAALPGICVAFLLTSSRSFAFLFIGAMAAGLLGAYLIQVITRRSRIKEDAALGIVLSVFFALGIVLLTHIQHSGAGNQAGLDKYLFGQAASLLAHDVKVMAVCAAIVCLLFVLFFKELKLLCFDPQFAHGLGFAPALLDGLLMVLLVLAVVVGLQAVGVVLISALLIVPAAAARFWTNRLHRMVWLAGLFGATSGMIGTWLSTLGAKMPTGPLIVLSATLIFILSLVFAPTRGLLAKGIRLLMIRTRIARENLLRALYELVEEQRRWDSPIDIDRLIQQRTHKPSHLRKLLTQLQKDRLIQLTGATVRLTEDGLNKAYEVVRNHRLWEMFLMHEGVLPADHVDRDADCIEHHLSPETVAELERLLRVHNLEPRVPHQIVSVH